MLILAASGDMHNRQAVGPVKLLKSLKDYDLWPMYIVSISKPKHQIHGIADRRIAWPPCLYSCTTSLNVLILKLAQSRFFCV